MLAANMYLCQLKELWLNP